MNRSNEVSHLAGSFDRFAQGTAARLAVEDVCDEEILRGVHYEGALFHVAADAEERQVTYPALGDKFLLLKHVPLFPSAPLLKKKKKKRNASFRSSSHLRSA